MDAIAQGVVTLMFDKLFQKQVLPSLIDIYKMEVLYQCLEQAPVGNICEIGVYKGGSANFIVNYLKEKNRNDNVFLIDTFEGIPYSSPYDNVHGLGHFGDVDYKAIKDFFNAFSNVKLFKGKVERFIVEQVMQDDEKVYSFVHIDTDVYESYNRCLNFFYPRIAKKGIMLLDDYGAESCKGAKKATDDFCKFNNIELEVNELGQAIIRK